MSKEKSLMAQYIKEISIYTPKGVVVLILNYFRHSETAGNIHLLVLWRLET
jgi:hypothetical protein